MATGWLGWARARRETRASMPMEGGYFRNGRKSSLEKAMPLVHSALHDLYTWRCILVSTSFARRGSSDRYTVRTFTATISPPEVPPEHFNEA